MSSSAVLVTIDHPRHGQLPVLDHTGLVTPAIARKLHRVWGGSVTTTVVDSRPNAWGLIEVPTHGELERLLNS